MDHVSSKFVIAMSALWGVPAVHWDGPNAYVKVEKEEDIEIYLEIPKGFDLHAQKGFERTKPSEAALRLRKSLYGLKEAGRLWNNLLHKKLTGAGFIQYLSDMYLYYQSDQKGSRLTRNTCRRHVGDCNE